MDRSPLYRRGATNQALALLLGGLLGAAACEPSGQAVSEDAVTAGDTAEIAELPHDTSLLTVDGVGLASPESAIHDAEADVYLVSNINGQPTGVDDNGFISRIRPDGTVEELRWIDGRDQGFQLDAPKGLAIDGNTLYVADIDSVRAFDRTTGEYRQSWGVPDATFVNDVAVGPDGTVYVTDTGLTSSMASSGTDAIYRFENGEAIAVSDSRELNGPNGIVAFGDSLAVVSFGGASLRILPASPEGPASENLGRVRTMLPGPQLDGVVRLDDGTYYVSSWANRSVYRVPPEDSPKETQVVAAGISSPADIGYDATRQRVLIPVLQDNRLEIHPVSPE